MTHWEVEMIRFIPIVAWTVNTMDIPDIEPILAIMELTLVQSCADERF